LFLQLYKEGKLPSDDMQDNKAHQKQVGALRNSSHVYYLLSSCFVCF
jgi:hypothetical protein